MNSCIILHSWSMSSSSRVLMVAFWTVIVSQTIVYKPSLLRVPLKINAAMQIILMLSNNLHYYLLIDV